MPELTLWMDGKIPIRVDEEEFEIIKLMLSQAGAVAVADSAKAVGVVRELVKQGYERARALELVTMARSELRRKQ